MPIRMGRGQTSAFLDLQIWMDTIDSSLEKHKMLEKMERKGRRWQLLAKWRYSVTVMMAGLGCSRKNWRPWFRTDQAGKRPPVVVKNWHWWDGNLWVTVERKFGNSLQGWVINSYYVYHNIHKVALGYHSPPFSSYKTEGITKACFIGFLEGTFIEKSQVNGTSNLK